MFLGIDRTIIFKFENSVTNEVWRLVEVLKFAIGNEVTAEDVLARPEFLNYKSCQVLLSQCDFLGEINNVFPKGSKLSLIVRQRPDNINFTVSLK